ncbi:tumor protein p63-regulated gene 1-like protein isoform X1 [Ischnura elegans]|uniref:tumor protein p63-regulated gene 1-like protein isoform X1 n=1 Tax=Ischnura elegans TaxID=197161 RepID=UPI001ED8A21C|nr:tumor protein p63-regulated gene 1-like protein isoform X1 [Ischnura elegans]
MSANDSDMTECKYEGKECVTKDNESVSTMDDTLLDEEAAQDDFQGATLQIRSDPYYLNSRSPSPKVETPKTSGNMQVAPSALPFNSVENAKDFFSFRSGLVDSAIEECLKTLVFPEKDGEVIGCWLLTEISFWDAEKERLVILTTHTLITVKYDFIALRQLDCRAVPLRVIDTLVTGELVYPPASLVPRMNGLASGVLTVVKGCLLRPLQQKWSKEKTTADCPLSNNSSSPYDLISSFEPRSRNTKGVRALWNRGAPISFGRRWNPFNSDIPFVTYTFHPLYWARQKQREVLDSNDPFLDDKTYDLDDFSEKLISAVKKENSEALERGNCLKFDDCKEASEGSKVTVDGLADSAPVLHHNTMPLKVEQCPIVLQSYVGLGSLIHNRNGLGFFKVRGKFSF